MKNKLKVILLLTWFILSIVGGVLASLFCEELTVISLMSLLLSFLLLLNNEAIDDDIKDIFKK